MDLATQHKRRSSRADVFVAIIKGDIDGLVRPKIIGELLQNRAPIVAADGRAARDRTTRCVLNVPVVGKHRRQHHAVQAPLENLVASADGG